MGLQLMSVDRRVTERDLREITEYLESCNAMFEGLEVLVAGGAGFLGSWACDVLERAGADIACVDNFSSGNTANLNHLRKRKSIRIFNADICDLKSFDRIDSRPDIIMHLAATPNPMEYVTKSVSTLLSNTLGTYYLLQYARNIGASFVYASSSEVYGDSEKIPTPETYFGNVNPAGPRSCYDEGKRCSESFVKAFEYEFGLDTRILRIFNTYGPRMRFGDRMGRAIPRFMTQALCRSPITILGNGSQTRSFTYVTDTMRGLLQISVDNAAKNQVFNIGNNKETEIIELVNLVLKLSASKSEVLFEQLPEDDPKRRVPDISKAKALLGWVPTVSLEDGLARTLSWIQDSGLRASICRSWNA